MSQYCRSLLLGIICSAVVSAADAPPEPPKPDAPKTEADKPADPVLQSTDPNYLIDLAQTHFNYSFADRAEPYARKAIELLKPANTQLTIRAHTLLGQILERRNDAKGAVEHYSAAIAAVTDPGQKAQMMLTLSQAKAKAGDVEGAAASLAEARTLLQDTKNPNNAYLLREIRRRELDLARQDPKRAATMISDAEAAIAKDPKDKAALERLSEYYSSVKPDPKKALPIQEALAELDPQSLDVLSRLSSLYQQNQQLDKALETTQKVIKVAPKEQQSFYAYQAATQMIQAGKKEDAVKFFEANLGSEPQNRDLSLLALVYDQSGDLEKAEAALRKAADAPNVQPAEKAMTLARLADICRRRKDYTNAEALLRTVLKDYADQANLQSYAKTLLVQVFREQGKEFKE